MEPCADWRRSRRRRSRTHAAALFHPARHSTGAGRSAAARRPIATVAERISAGLPGTLAVPVEDPRAVATAHVDGLLGPPSLERPDQRGRKPRHRIDFRREADRLRHPPHRRAYAIGAWLMQFGLGVGSVVADIRLWKQNQVFRARMHDDKRWRPFLNSESFLRGDTRSMVRYLGPGTCLLLQVDHHRGRLIEGDWDKGRLQMSSGAFRIARLAGAAVIPVVVFDDGRWRFRVHVGTPVPQHFIDEGDESAAATHVARELMPIVADHPREAMITLVRSTLPPRKPRTRRRSTRPRRGLDRAVSCFLDDHRLVAQAWQGVDYEIGKRLVGPHVR